MSEDRHAAADRGWWRSVYRAGSQADLEGLPRKPPTDLTPAQREVWLDGYDR